MQTNGVCNKTKEIKMATFTNQATLSYNGNTTNSNVTTGELISTLTATKTAISQTYSRGEGVAYAVTLVNSGTTPLTGISLTDNLGAYTVGAETFYPLDYVDGSVRLIINGLPATAPTVEAGPPLVISAITIPPSSNAVILYEATANQYAPLAIGSSITNTATVTGGTIAEAIVSTATVNVATATALTIAKAVCPDVVTDNGELTYTFIIQNSGNEPANADANIVITDLFNPILTGIAVTLNGEAFPATSYTYDETSGEFATLPGSVTVPAATYTTSTAGEIVLTPGVAVLKISGTV